jgi:hypothetical protein
LPTLRLVGLLILHLIRLLIRRLARLLRRALILRLICRLGSATLGIEKTTD